MLHTFYCFLSVNVLLYIIVFVYHGFYELTLFFIIYIYLQNGGTKKKKKKKKKVIDNNTNNNLNHVEELYKELFRKEDLFSPQPLKASNSFFPDFSISVI